MDAPKILKNEMTNSIFEKYKYLFPYIAAFCGALLISLLFSFKQKFPYNFQKGQQWQYHSLYAPFEFEIEKSPAQIDSLTNYVSSTFIPHLTMDKEGYKFAQEILEKEFKRQLGFSSRENPTTDVGRNAKTYFKVSEQILREIYEKGIVPNQLPALIRNTEIVIVVNGKNYVKDSLSSLYTVVSARDHILDTLTHFAIREPEFVYKLLENCIQSNLTYDAETNAKYKTEALQHLMTNQDTIKTGALIVANGGLISASIDTKLNTFKDQYGIKNQRVKGTYFYFGFYLLATSIFFLGFVYFARNFERHKKLNDSLIFFIIGGFVLFAFFTYLQNRLEFVHPAIIPFGVLALYLRSILSKNISFIAFMVMVMVASLIVEERYEFLISELAVGIVVVFMSLDLEENKGYIKMLSTVFFVQIFTLYIFYWINTQKYFELDKLLLISILHLALFIIFIPILPLFDHWIKVVTDFTLVKLIDERLPLFQKMKSTAPGTLQHSRNVANMAYEAAKLINARPLLAKAGAMYHDIGKLENPSFFLENQTDFSPHTTLQPIESAMIIKNHVTNGLAIAQKNRLPDPIIDFIKTHHGNSRIETFYKKHIEQDGNEDDSAFYYEGPRPSTKEQAIVMLADSTEAAFRRYSKNSGETVESLIGKVIESKWKTEQLAESSFSFKDLEACKKLFIQMLKTQHQENKN